MINDDVIERVYNTLSPNPQRCVDMAQTLRMNSNRVRFVLAILKRQGRAKRLDKTVELTHGFRTQRSFWVKE